MKRVLAALLLVGLGGIGSASAAGLDGAAYDWSGIYAGLDLGAASGQVNALDITQPNGGFFTDEVPAGTEGFSFNAGSIAAGAHAGAQYQWQQLVFGGEVTFGGTGISDKIVSPYFPDSDTETGSIGRFATAVGRVGYAFDHFMIYGKAGYAGGEVGFRAHDADSLAIPVTYQQSVWQNGYALGAGVDYALTDTLSVGIDYTHLNLGSGQSTGPNVFADGSLGVNPETYRTTAAADVIMGRLSVKFGAD